MFPSERASKIGRICPHEFHATVSKVPNVRGISVGKYAKLDSVIGTSQYL